MCAIHIDFFKLANMNLDFIVNIILECDLFISHVICDSPPHHVSLTVRDMMGRRIAVQI